MREHRIARHRLAGLQQYAEQSRSRLGFVGPGINTQLLQQGGGSRNLGCQQVHAGNVAMRRSACHFAVEGDGVPAVVLEASGDPGSQSVL